MSEHVRKKETEKGEKEHKHISRVELVHLINFKNLHIAKNEWVTFLFTRLDEALAFAIANHKKFVSVVAFRSHHIMHE